MVSLRRTVCAITILLVALVAFAGSARAAEPIPTAIQLASPITLPKGKSEMGLGMDFIEKQNGSGWYLYPALYLRHGITDDLEIIPLGVRYRFYNDVKNKNQLAAKCRLAGSSDASGDEAFYSWEAGVEGKWSGSMEVAVTYGLGNYRTEYTKRTFANVLDLSAGVIISMGNMLATDITYGHQFITGLDSSNADSVALTIHWNVAPDAELTLATTSHFLPRNDSFRTYGMGGINQASTLGVIWRF